MVVRKYDRVKGWENIKEIRCGYAPSMNFYDHFSCQAQI